MVLLMDIGGTHCRAKMVRDMDRLFDEQAVISSPAEKISDKQAFLAFIRELLGTGDKAVKPNLAVLCFAGPIIDGSVSMVNWQGQRDVSMEELVQAGLPENGITLLNDMEAAAYALVACNKDHIRIRRSTLYPVAPPERRRNANAVLMIPGTGIGVAAVIDRSGSPPGEPQVLGCELQHTPIPELDANQQDILKHMKTKLAISQPSWEDFISGKGLENIHRCLIPEQEGRENPGAETIAKLAVQGKDRYCVSALNMFYQCCGALAQVLALTFQPYGGIYLGGESTRRNLGFIGNSPLLRQLQDNEVRGGLLREFPVYLVEDELNLSGAAYAAALSF